MVVVRTSRPATADRRTMTWEEAAGEGGDMVRRERGGEERKMRRLSQQSVEGMGVGVSYNNTYFTDGP